MGRNKCNKTIRMTLGRKFSPGETDVWYDCSRYQSGGYFMHLSAKVSIYKSSAYVQIIG